MRAKSDFGMSGRSLTSPVKDNRTVPWVSELEIPAIKIVLSKWRKLRKSKEWRDEMRNRVTTDLIECSKRQAEIAAEACEVIMVIDDRLREERDGC